MKAPCLLLLLGAAALAADSPGLKPKFEATDYPAHAAASGATLGARLLTPEQVRGAFSTDLNRGYVVIEVAVYPQNGEQLDLGPGDFTLRLEGTDTSARPAAPKTIAQVLSKTASGDRDIELYPTVGVGYESGRGYDPVYGGRGRLDYGRRSWRRRGPAARRLDRSGSQDHGTRTRATSSFPKRWLRRLWPAISISRWSRRTSAPPTCWSIRARRDGPRWRSTEARHARHSAQPVLRWR